MSFFCFGFYFYFSDSFYFSYFVRPFLFCLFCFWIKVSGSGVGFVLYVLSHGELAFVRGFRVWGSGFRVQGLGFGVWVLGFRVGCVELQGICRTGSHE